MSTPSTSGPATAVAARARAAAVPESYLDASDRLARARAKRAATARQASGRRRRVDPTTCERDYSQAELEFMRAMHAYKQESGRPFPTWSEVLEVFLGLGYRKAGA